MKKQTKELDSKRPIYKKKSFWIILIACVTVVVMTLVTLLDCSIICLGIKIACKPRKLSTPENYSEILQNTSAQYDIVYDSDYDNNLLDVFYPKESSGNNPTLLYIHGGYYVGGDKKSAEPYCRMIADRGYTVVSMNYALAPKYKYPVQLRQVNEVFEFLKNNANMYHVDMAQVFIGGDSAGAHLSAQAGALYTNPSFALKVNVTPAIEKKAVKGLILNCGLYNMDTVRGCKFPFLNTAMWALTDFRDFENYTRIDEMNILKIMNEDYPDTFITCGKDDPFITQAEEMIECLKKNKISYIEYLPESQSVKLKHEFQRDYSLEEAYIATNTAIDFIGERTGVSLFESQEIHAIFNFQNGVKLDVLLDGKHAPATVANFIAYAEAGFYNNTAFHRIIKGSVLQGGGFYYDGETKNYVQKTPLFDPIKGEFSANGYNNNTSKHIFGTISMARTNDMNSATSQFFFCSCEIEAYNGNYASFGRVINVDGLSALEQLTQKEVEALEQPIILSSVTIIYKDIR